MPKFDKPEELERHLKKAMDALMAEVIVTTQAELGSSRVSPVDTGRLRSSWFAAEGSPSNEVAPEGANMPNSDATSLRVDSGKSYFLTNSLPYAQNVAIEGHVVSKPANWFHEFRDVRIPKIQEAASRVVKDRFELS
jgi:hypothetical protein